jgi:hypothetical protein
VHTNSIRGKDQQAKMKGPNPLEYLGVVFSSSGDKGTLTEYTDGTWKEYSEIDGSASYRTGGVAEQYRGRGFMLSNWYTSYDWVADNRFTNSSSWIG